MTERNTQLKIQTTHDLRSEMLAVARGEKPAPADAGGTSFESARAVLQLLSPENRQLLAMIRDRRPQSVAELAKLSGRASSNLLRTLAKLESAGFVRMDAAGERRKAPVAIARSLRVEIDPYSQNDRLEIG